MKFSQVFLSAAFLVTSITIQSQNIENQELLKPFLEKLEENRVSQILFIGDSHIQADHLTGYLRKKFQQLYGNAGRGLVFPYQVANTNGAEDFSSATNTPWETFRLVHEQKIFPEIGASGFVIGNEKDSFLEITLKNPEDSFDKVIIYNDLKMNGKPFSVYFETQPLQNFAVKRSQIIYHTAISGQTFHEIVSQYNTTTTKLRALNGDKILNPANGASYKVEKNDYQYNPDFEKNISFFGSFSFTATKTEVSYRQPQNIFLMKTNNPEGNIFYGFQFLKDVKKGIVFNTVGVNGATYADFLKYPLQLTQLSKLNPDVLFISLGTNEAFGKVEKEEFQDNIDQVISKFRNENAYLPVVLIGPPDNLAKETRTLQIISWIKESAEKKHAAFFDLFQAMGGKGYFRKAQTRKEASGDGVHYLKPGYENQAETIWKAIKKITEN